MSALSFPLICTCGAIRIGIQEGVAYYQCGSACRVVKAVGGAIIFWVTPRPKEKRAP